ncbi:MAG: hypothetical protein NT007_06990 [Candidatus Kapabacteria bacterium]|nr:hypothetical protein [Candidatus Kapabacteria bacterium]
MKNIQILLIIIGLFISCKQNPNQTVKSGELRGVISALIDYKFATPVKATIFIPQINKQFVTDSIGTFIIKDLPEGIYDLIISKNGFDSTAIFGYFFKGEDINLNDDLTSNKLFCCPNTIFDGHELFLYNPNGRNISSLNIATYFTYDSVKKDSIASFYFSDNTISDNDPLILMGLNPNLSRYDNNTFAISNNLNDKNIFLTFFSGGKNYISLSKLKGNGFNSGQRIYFIAYMDGAGRMKDKRTNRTMWLGLSLNSSNIVSITIP